MLRLNVNKGRASLVKVVWRTAAGATIDKKWIEGIRKGWKRIVQQVSRVSERNEGLDSLEAIDNAIRYVKLLQQDLFFGKGMYPFQGDQRPIKKQLSDKPPFNIQAKVSVHLEKAIEAFEEAQRKIKYWMAVTNPHTSEYKLDGGRRSKEIAENPRFKGRSEGQAVMKFLNWQAPVLAQESAKEADQAISGKLLRALSSFANQYPGMDIGVGIDREFSIGRMKIIFEDIPTKNLSRLSPENIAEIRSPLYAKRYVKPMANAHTLLRTKGLDFLWYGLTRIECKTCGGTNPYSTPDKVFGVGGNYTRSKDIIRVFVNPDTFVTELMVHELGHRYYYKFMSMADREEFSSYFGQVPGVSDYGKTVSAEDFAEVFAWYVLNRNLSRDQLERFKKFLGRKKQRGASAEEVEGRGGLKGPFTQEQKYGDETYYTMDVAKDRFIHFTTVEAARAILKSKKLLLNPPGVEHFGPTGVFAVSLVWGWYVPTTQLTHIKSDKPLVAVVFTTDTKPGGAAFHEEVIWRKDVKLKTVSVVSKGKAIQLLKRVPFPLKKESEDAYVLYR